MQPSGLYTPQQQYLTEAHNNVAYRHLSMVSRSGVMPFAAASQGFEATIPNRGNGVLIAGFSVAFNPASVVQSVTNFYTATAAMRDSAGATNTLTLAGTLDTKAFITTGRYWEMPVTCTSGILAAANFLITLALTPSGAPGTFFGDVTVYYQIL